MSAVESFTNNTDIDIPSDFGDSEFPDFEIENVQDSDSEIKLEEDSDFPDLNKEDLTDVESDYFPDFKDDKEDLKEKDLIADLPMEDGSVLDGTDDKLNSVPLPSDSTIEVNNENGNTTIYKTDTDGRVSEVSSQELENKNIPRTREGEYQQGKCGQEDGIKDGCKNDDGGHLIADRFDGSGKQINLVPQDCELNQHGTWKKMENSIARDLNDGKKVTDYNVEIEYDGDSKRPSGFEVSYKVDGELKTSYHDNTPS